MKSTESENLVETLARSGFYFQAGLCDTPEVLVSTFVFVQVVFPGDFCRESFQGLHFGYEPVPEVYVAKEVFDSFCPPRQHLNKLRDELGRDIDIDLFIEALGCYFQPNDQQLDELNSRLRFKVPLPQADKRSGLVLMCWGRIHAAAAKLGASAHHLLLVVAFHEHSHAARSATLLRSNQPEILQAEENVSQWEAYMFLRSRNEQAAIEAMKKLMDEQPNCYRIPMP